MLVHKYNFLLQILLKLMHTSHDFIATKTFPSCEFLVVFGRLQVNRKSAVRGRCGLGWSAVWVRVGSVQVRGQSGQNFLNSCGYGAGRV